MSTALRLSRLEDRTLPSTIAFVQPLGTSAGAGSGQTSLNLITTGDVAAGHDVILEFAMRPAAGGLSAFAHLPGDATHLVDFQLDADATNTTPFGGPGAAVRAAVFSAMGVPALPAGTVITITSPPTGALAASAAEFRGLSADGPLDQVAFATGLTRTVSSGIAPVSQQANELLVGAVGVAGSIGRTAPSDATHDLGFAAGSGYTVWPGAASSSSNAKARNVAIHPEYRTVGVPAGYQADGTLQGSASGPWADILAEYRADTTTHFQISAPSTIESGRPFVVTVTAEDAANHIATGYTGTVHFASSDTGSGVALPGDVTFTPADHGVRQITVTLVTDGLRSITATDTENVPVLTGSASVQVHPAGFTVSAPATTTAGQSFSTTVAARRFDGSVDSSYAGTVHFTSSDTGTGSARPADYPFSAADNGVHTFSNGVTFVTVGTQTITATDTSTANITGSASVVVSAPDFPLTAGAFTPPSPVAGTPITGAILFHFTDADPHPSAGDFVATVTWGDGTAGDSVHDSNSVVVAASGGGFDVLGSHTYLAGATGLMFVVEVQDIGGAAPLSASTLINVSADAVISGTSGSDTLTVTRTPGMAAGSVTYVLNGGAPVALSNISTFTFHGMGGDDSMTVELANGAPLVAAGISFDGGAGLNALTIDAAGTPVRTPLGTVNAGGQAIGYTSLGQLFINDAAGVNAAAGPDTKDRATAFAGLNPAERAVQALYLAALGRAGSQAELDAWVSLLPPGAASLSPAVVSAIENSVEARDHLVKSWYLSYLGRSAIGGEEQGFVQLLEAGQFEEQTLSLVLGSSEFYARAQTLVPSGTADERFVQSLFLDLLDRTASPAEVAPYVSAISQIGRNGVALAFLESQEFRTIQFNGYYDALLHRPASSAELASLGALVTSGLDIQSVRLVFETSAEFFANG